MSYEHSLASELRFFWLQVAFGSLALMRGGDGFCFSFCRLVVVDDVVVVILRVNPTIVGAARAAVAGAVVEEEAIVVDSLRWVVS